MSDALSSRQVKAIAVLTQGGSGREAAEACKVTPQTLSEWRQNPEFKSRLDTVKMEVLESARDNLQSAAQTAVQALVDLAKNSTHQETRRKAALNILEMTGFTRETIEMFAWGVDSVVIEEAEHEKVTETVSELATILRNKIADMK